MYKKEFIFLIHTRTHTHIICTKYEVKKQRKIVSLNNAFLGKIFLGKWASRLKNFNNIISLQNFHTYLYKMYFNYAIFVSFYQMKIWNLKLIIKIR